MRECGLDGLLLLMQPSSSRTTICNIPIFWAWAIRSQLLWALLSLFILWGRRWDTKTMSVLPRLPGPLTQPELAHWLKYGNIFGVYCSEDCTQK